MANETKADVRFLAAGAEKVAPQQKNAPEERRGGWIARGITPLVAGLAILASAPVTTGCDNSNPIVNEDADSDVVEQDGEADAVEPEDGAHEDVEDVPDLTEELVEDAGPDSDVPDVEPDSDGDGGAEADVEVTDEVEVLEDSGEAEADVPECTPGTPHTEEVNRPAADNVCDNPFETGSVQEGVETWEITPLSGEGCDPERRVLLIYEIRFNPALNAEGLWCARGDVLSMPWGDETVVSMATDSVTTAPTVGGAVLGSMEMHDWGTGEYRSRITNFVSDSVVSITTYDSTGAVLGPVRTETTGFWPLPSAPGMPERAYVTADVDTMFERAEISYTGTPSVDRVEGGTVSHAGGIYTIHFNVSGTEHGGIILTRE